MAEATDHGEVWIGVAGVVPREGCELLSPGEGAFVTFLTLASSDSEYRAKVSGALSFLPPRTTRIPKCSPLDAV